MSVEQPEQPNAGRGLAAISRIKLALVKGPPLWLCVVAIGTIISARHPTPLFRAELWAEDGSVFFKESFEKGLVTLWTPVTGYQLLLSRLIAYFAKVAFPVVAIPFVYAAVSLVINAGVLAYFTREGFLWILPRRSHRFAVACILALGPGTAEVFLNLANLQASLTLLCFLLLLEKPWNPSAKLCALLAGLFVSTGSAFLVAPLLVLLALVTRKWAYAAPLATLVVSIFLNTLTHSAAMAAQTNLQNVSHVPSVILNNFALRFLLVPFLVEGAANLLFKAPSWIFWSACIPALLVASVVVKRAGWSRTETLVLLGVACSVSTVFGAIIITRAENLVYVSQGIGLVMWSIRYSFLPGSFALMIWLSGLVRIATIESLIAVLLICGLVAQQWPNGFPRDDLHWPQTARQIEQALRKRQAGERISVHLPLQPASYPPASVQIVP